MRDNELDLGRPGRKPEAVPFQMLLEEVANLSPDLNRIEESDSWRVLDMRDLPSFRSGHVPGSVHVEPAGWNRKLFLLPPRGRRVCVLASTESAAEEFASQVQQAGWKTVGFSVAPSPGLPGLALASGPADSVLWEPTPWLREVAPDLPRTGQSVDFACGSGRNAVYLAWTRTHGADEKRRPGTRTAPDGAPPTTVHGVDILPDALEQGREILDNANAAVAARRLPHPDEEAERCSAGEELKVCFHQADLTTEAGREQWLAESRWSAVVVFRYLDREILPALAASLAPGGHLVYQTFLEEQRTRKGSPRSDRHLLRPGELRASFESLEILRYGEGEDDDGNVLASLWARRP